MLKSSSKPKGDHVTHFKNWIERPIAQSSVWKCLYGNDTIEGGGVGYDVNAICTKCK